MPFLLSKTTADWLRSAMGRGRGFGSRPRRIAYGRESLGDIMLAIVSDNDTMNVASDGLYTARLFPSGIDSAGEYTTGTLALTDVLQGARLPVGTALLAHRICVRSIPDGGDD